jgi:hypothetical protein
MIAKIKTIIFHFIYLINGNWGAWQDWNSCSVRCGSGSRSRYQECNNPEPAHGLIALSHTLNSVERSTHIRHVFPELNYSKIHQYTTSQNTIQFLCHFVDKCADAFLSLGHIRG